MIRAGDRSDVLVRPVPFFRVGAMSSPFGETVLTDRSRHKADAAMRASPASCARLRRARRRDALRAACVTGTEVDRKPGDPVQHALLGREVSWWQATPSGQSALLHHRRARSGPARHGMCVP